MTSDAIGTIIRVGDLVLLTGKMEIGKVRQISGQSLKVACDWQVRPGQGSQPMGLVHRDVDSEGVLVLR